MDLRPPEAFDFGQKEDPGPKWKRWRQRFKYFLTATEKLKKSAEVQVSLLLSVLGADGCDIFDTFEWAESEAVTLDAVLEKFDKHCDPYTNVPVARFKFHGIEQGDISFDEFVTKLRIQAKLCAYGDQEPSMIRDMIIYHCRSSSLRTRILREVNPDLDKVVRMGKAEEQSKTLSEVIQKGYSSPERKPTETQALVATSSKAACGTRCKSCGFIHEKVAVSSERQSLLKVRSSGSLREDMFRKERREKGGQQSQFRAETNFATVPGSSDDESWNMIGGSLQEEPVALSVTTKRKRIGWKQYLGFKKGKVEFWVDTGATLSVISEEKARSLGEKVRPSTANLFGYGGHTIPVVGEMWSKVVYKGRSFQMKFIVTAVNTDCLAWTTCDGLAV